MTDPTITIAGLRARINSLLSAVQHSNRTTAERVTMFVEASSNADRLTAERDALAAQLTEVRAELVQLGGADLARDAAEDRAARLDADLAKVRAELAAAPKVCAIHSYALEGPCMTCGAPWPGAEKALRQERVEGMEKMRRISAAVGCPNSVEEVVEAVAAIKSDLASERARLAAYKERIAGLEQAADQRTRSLDAALTAERETSRGLVAQVDTWRDTWARVETIVDEAFGPFPVWPVYDTICAMERGIHDGIRAAQELAAIRDLVAPGNPQGTVVDAVRASVEWVRHEVREATEARDAAIECADRHEKARDAAVLRHREALDEIAKLRKQRKKRQMTVERRNKRDHKIKARNRVDREDIERDLRPRA